MRKISPEAFDLSLSRGQSPNPFMATLSSGAISSQQQSMLPPLPQQQSVPPPHPQQWSASPPPLQQQSAFLPHQWSMLPPNNSLCHFPYSWKPSLIMWMLLDQMMRGFLPQCKHALTNGSVLMGLRNSPCLHLELTQNLQTLVKCMITVILIKRRGPLTEAVFPR